MTDDTASTPPAEDAFALLGNDTRMGILRALGDAGEPLSFSALYDRVDVQGSGQFNYHLEQLVGHFVAKTDAGYDLTRAGRRVVEAVLAGTVTRDPTVERTRVAETCPHCDAPVEVVWQSGNVWMYCTECQGRYGSEHDVPGDGGDQQGDSSGYLGRHPLPPAGVQGRTPEEMLRAAWTWGNLEIMAMASGLCPRCSGSVERSVRVCEDHDPGSGRCGSCDNRYAVNVSYDCTTCIFGGGGMAVIALVTHPALLDLLTDHGHNPVAPDRIHDVSQVHSNYEERVVSTDPLEAEFTFALGGDTLLLRVDEHLDVIEATRNP
jgi:hypothetical protein